MKRLIPLSLTLLSLCFLLAGCIVINVEKSDKAKQGGPDVKVEGTNATKQAETPH